MIDFKAHNEKAKAIWEAYESGNPIRVPVVIYADVRNWINESSENTKNITMTDYINNPDIMLECQIKASEWIRHNILSDSEMGYPQNGWSVMVEFQNFLESVWFGAPIVDGSEPHSAAFLTDDNKWSLLDKGIPEPFSGINAEVVRRYEYYREQINRYFYQGIPLTEVHMPYNMMGTDGPFTIACSMRGAGDFIMDILDDNEYAHQLMGLITQAIIQRIKKVRKYIGLEEAAESFGFADDSIVLLSPDMYKEFVFPYHKRIFDELTTENSSRGMHLCGDAQRFFPILEQELNVKSFDTGFPIDFERLYKELSPDVCIMGGPSTKLIRYGTPESVKKEAKRILGSGVMDMSKRFILREGNALAPGTPIRNVNAIYEAAEEFGYY
jgi:uroporphyrinogen-III decarboxylase